MGPTFHSAEEEANMQNSKKVQCDLSGASIDLIGGEPLAGSGFETEKPDPTFSAAELEGEE